MFYFILWGYWLTLQKYVHICCKQYGRWDHLMLLKRTTLKWCKGGCRKICRSFIMQCWAEEEGGPTTIEKEVWTGILHVSQPQTGSSNQSSPSRRSLGKAAWGPEDERKPGPLQGRLTGDPAWGHHGWQRAAPAEAEGQTHSRQQGPTRKPEPLASTAGARMELSSEKSNCASRGRRLEHKPLCRTKTAQVDDLV